MLARVVAAAVAGASAVVSLQTIAADDAAYVAWDGRAYPAGAAGGVGFEWLGTGARVAHNGSVLRAQVLPTSHAYKLAFAQVVEGYVPQQGVTWVAPSDAGGPGLVVTVGAGRAVVSLNTPPQYFAQQGGTGGITTFTTDGAFLPAVRSSRVLHFVGDSITAATNVVGGVSPGGCADEGYQANWAASWSGILCNYFDADCSTVAVGGKGLVRNCCDSGLKMPDYYVRTRATDAEPTFDFAADRVPAGVVIYLGTNDYSAGGSPALDAEFTAAYVQFMYNVTRVWYGTPAAPANVTFFATLGPMAPTLPTNATVAAVAQGLAAGFRVVLLNVTTACGEALAGCSDGCAHHPGQASHRSMAAQAVPVLEAALGWGPI